MMVASLPSVSRGAAAEDVVNVTLQSLPVAEGLAFNGTIPGPLLRVVHGQRIRVRYVSQVEVPTSIHWHGMLLPNAMDGVAGVTQPPVLRGETFVYEFAPGPPGTRWYHDHAFSLGSARGLFGMFIVDHPAEEPADREYALVFHDVPDWRSFDAALRGVSSAPMTEPMSAVHATLGTSPRARMGDEIAYVAHRINGAGYPHGAKYPVRVGERARLRVLNASPTQTRYVALAGHQLLVTHADGNSLPQPVTVDALRVGAGERYDATVEFRAPGAFLLQGVSSDPMEMRQQAVLFYTEGMQNAAPQTVPAMLDGLAIATYETLGGIRNEAPPKRSLRTTSFWAAADGAIRGGRSTIAFGRIRRNWWCEHGERVALRFRNAGDMEHPMHLHRTRVRTRRGERFAPGPAAAQRRIARRDRAAPRLGVSLRTRRPGAGCCTATMTCTMAGGMMMEVVYRR